MSLLEERLHWVKRSLRGLALGDGLGRSIFREPRAIAERRAPKGPWLYSDDTRMALAVARVLRETGQIDQALLAQQFASDFREQPERGYGAVAHFILHQIAEGVPWPDAAHSVYKGQGSKGNGAAMRVAPVGAYFHDDLDTAALQARLSAEVTHAHPEGQAGAIAIAVAAALAVQIGRGQDIEPARWLQMVYERTPLGLTRDGIGEALKLQDTKPQEAGQRLGTGKQILAEDTVPLALWSTSRSLKNYEQGLWLLFEALDGPESDSDTLGAIVGGILGLSCFCQSKRGPFDHRKGDHFCSPL